MSRSGESGSRRAFRVALWFAAASLAVTMLYPLVWWILGQLPPDTWVLGIVVGGPVFFFVVIFAPLLLLASLFWFGVSLRRSVQERRERPVPS